MLPTTPAFLRGPMINAARAAAHNKGFSDYVIAARVCDELMPAIVSHTRQETINEIIDRLNVAENDMTQPCGNYAQIARWIERNIKP